MLTAQVDKVIGMLGANDVGRDMILLFIGSAMPFLDGMTIDKCNAMIEISLDDISERQVIAGNHPLDARERESARSVLWRAISSAPSRVEGQSPSALLVERSKFVLAHARKIPAAVVHKIGAILERLPVIGTVLEIAPHEDLMIAKIAIAAKKLRDVDEVIEVHGLPNVAEWRRSNVQTIILNVIGMRAVAHDLINFVIAIAQANLAIFAIVVHSDDVVIFSPSRVASIAIGNVSLSILSASEKKIVGVSDIISGD